MRGQSRGQKLCKTWKISTEDEFYERTLNWVISTDWLQFGNVNRINQIARSYNASKHLRKGVLIIISGTLIESGGHGCSVSGRRKKHIRKISNNLEFTAFSYTSSTEYSIENGYTRQKDGRFGAQRLVLVGLWVILSIISYQTHESLDLHVSHMYTFYVVLNKVKTSSTDAASWWYTIVLPPHVWSGCVGICQKVQEAL